MRRKSPRPSEMPPGYPPEYERLLQLSDGRLVFVRPIIPSDATELGEAIRTADPETLRWRFLSGGPVVTPELLHHLTTVDYGSRFALAAFDDKSGRGVAIARYEPLGEGTAEIAVVVDPAWRRVGLATVLVELLAEAAAERGVRTFSVYYLAENRPVAALLADAGGARQLIEQGIAEAVIALDQEHLAEAHERIAEAEVERRGRWSRAPGRKRRARAEPAVRRTTPGGGDVAGAGKAPAGAEAADETAPAAGSGSADGRAQA